MAQDTDATDAPTATEFIPADEISGPRDHERNQIRTLVATGDKGVEIASHEPYDDTVTGHVYICDECGHEEPTENAIGHHLWTHQQEED